MWLVKFSPAPSLASLPTTTNTTKIYCQFHVTFSSLPSTLFLLPIKTLIFYGLEERLNLYTWLKSIEDYNLVCSILMFSWMIHLWSNDVMEYYFSRPGMELGLRVKGGKSITFFFFLKLQISIHLEEKCYVHNIFTTFSQQFVSGRQLLVVMSGQKGNLSYDSN